MTSLSRDPMTRRPGRPRADEGSDVPSQLRAAARGVFSTYGYEAASVAQIAKRAGVAPTAVYHHFGNKEALWEAVFLEVLSTSYNRVEGQLLNGSSLTDALNYFVGLEIHMPDGVSYSREFLIRCAADMRAFPELAKYQHHRESAQIRVFRGLTEMGIRTGGIHPSRNPEHVTELLRTIVMGHLWERYTHPDLAAQRAKNLSAILPEILDVLSRPAE